MMIIISIVFYLIGFLLIVSALVKPKHKNAKILTTPEKVKIFFFGALLLFLGWYTWPSPAKPSGQVKQSKVPTAAQFPGFDITTMQYSGYSFLS